MSAIVRTVGSVEHIPQCCCPVALDKGPSAPGSLAGDVRNLYWNLSQELYIIFYIKLKYFNTFFSDKLRGFSVLQLITVLHKILT